MFFFSTADSGLTAEEAARDKAKAAAGAAVPSGAWVYWLCWQLTADGLASQAEAHEAGRLLALVQRCSPLWPDAHLLPTPSQLLQARALRARVMMATARRRCTSTCLWSLR